ncbi:hypothetical protein NMY22_g19047 [Coprinellus aureogranulatus]|nr:hypothetical protein NMY22_g19047 [Coprinellus aureogranulatus]
MLDSVTANDMHALIVGINDFEVFPSLTECVDDARKVAEYLQDTLLVPRSQIVTLINSEATKERIIEELKALAHKASVVDGPPIVIYFATHSFVESSTKSTYLVPFIDDPGLKSANDINAMDLKRYTLAYSTIVDILKHLSEEKTSNTTLILDSCHAGAMGFNEKFSTPPSWPGGPKRFSPREGGRGMGAPGEDGMDESHEVASASKKNRGMAMARITKKTTEILVGHPSHILLAGTGTEDVAYEDRGKEDCSQGHFSGC